MRCSFWCSNHPAALAEPRGNLVEPWWNPGGTLVEPWWNPRGTLPQGRPGPPRSLSGLRPPSFQLLGGKKISRRSCAAHNEKNMLILRQGIQEFVGRVAQAQFKRRSPKAPTILRSESPFGKPDPSFFGFLCECVGQQVVRHSSGLSVFESSLWAGTWGLTHEFLGRWDLRHRAALA